MEGQNMRRSSVLSAVQVTIEAHILTIDRPSVVFVRLEHQKMDGAAGRRARSNYRRIRCNQQEIRLHFGTSRLCPILEQIWVRLVTYTKTVRCRQMLTFRQAALGAIPRARSNCLHAVRNVHTTESLHRARLLYRLMWPGPVSRSA
jgi:hypothetical protein